MLGRPSCIVMRVCSSLALFATAALFATVAACDADEGTPVSTVDAATGGPQLIGRAGGEVRLRDGAAVVVPVDALKRTETIEVARYDGLLPSPPTGLAFAGDAYAFTPHGQSFEMPVTIRIPYQSSRLDKVVLWLEAPIDPKWNELAEGPSYAMGIATLEVHSFSIYVVAHPDTTESIVCEEPLTACEGQCVDTSNDNDHCGACRSRCDTTCAGSICPEPPPPPPMDCETDADCDDALYCTGPETCFDGACQDGADPDCDDADPLTDDNCDEATLACVHVPVDVDAGI